MPEISEAPAPAPDEKAGGEILDTLNARDQFGFPTLLVDDFKLKVRVVTRPWTHTLYLTRDALDDIAAAYVVVANYIEGCAVTREEFDKWVEVEGDARERRRIKGWRTSMSCGRTSSGSRTPRSGRPRRRRRGSRAGSGERGARAARDGGRAERQSAPRGAGGGRGRIEGRWRRSVLVIWRVPSHDPPRYIIFFTLTRLSLFFGRINPARPAGPGAGRGG